MDGVEDELPLMKVTNNLYVISDDSGNVTFLVTGVGVLVVDLSPTKDVVKMFLQEEVFPNVFPFDKVNKPINPNIRKISIEPKSTRFVQRRILWL